ACTFAGAALSIAPLVARTDTPIAHGLETAARAVDAPAVRDALLRAAEVHRGRLRGRVRDSLPGSAWRGLLALADRRAASKTGDEATSAAVRAELDKQVLAKVEELCKDGFEPA